MISERQIKSLSPLDVFVRMLVIWRISLQTWSQRQDPFPHKGIMCTFPLGRWGVTVNRNNQKTYYYFFTKDATKKDALRIGRLKCDCEFISLVQKHYLNLNSTNWVSNKKNTILAVTKLVRDIKWHLIKVRVYEFEPPYKKRKKTTTTNQQLLLLVLLLFLLTNRVIFN